MSAGQWLYDEHPLIVSPSLAAEIGLNEAIVLQQVAPLADELIGDRWWVCKSYAEWQSILPFWSTKTIQRTFLSLEEKGLLVSKYLSADARDRAKWYSVNFEALKEIKPVAIGGGL